MPARKLAMRAADEAVKPLEAYRAEELERMKLGFYGFDPSYHVARYHFVFKLPKSRTPHYLVRHRAGPRSAWVDLSQRVDDPKAFSGAKEQLPLQYKTLIEQYYRSFQEQKDQ